MICLKSSLLARMSSGRLGRLLITGGGTPSSSSSSSSVIRAAGVFEKFRRDRRLPNFLLEVRRRMSPASEFRRGVQELTLLRSGQQTGLDTWE